MGTVIIVVIAMSELTWILQALQQHLLGYGPFRTTSFPSSYHAKFQIVSPAATLPA